LGKKERKEGKGDTQNLLYRGKGMGKMVKTSGKAGKDRKLTAN